MRLKPVVTLDDAKKMLAAGEAEAARNGLSVAIAILDDGANLVALHRMEGTRPSAPEIAVQKARTAALTQRTSKVWEDWIQGGRVSLVGLSILGLQGGLPIIVEGNCLGAVGVSGALSHQDEQFALAAVRAVFPEAVFVRPGD